MTLIRVIAACLVLGTAVPAFAQPFANAKSSLANYSVADTTPSKACESLSNWKCTLSSGCSQN